VIVTHHPQPPQWLTPQGVTAVSRWLSAAIPPVNHPNEFLPAPRQGCLLARRWGTKAMLVLVTVLFATPLFAQSTDPAADKLRAVYQAWEATGTSLSILKFERAGRPSREQATANAKPFGEHLDPHVAVIVTINPEGRVKVEPGPARLHHETGWYTPAMVKINNEAGLTSRLTVEAKGDHLTTARFYEAAANHIQPAITSQLCGAEVEYQAMLIRTQATGKREVTLSFQAGANSQDLGFRAELPVLLTPRPNPRLPIIPHKLEAWKTTDLAQRAKLLHQLQDRFEMVSGSTLDRRGLSLQLQLIKEEVVGTVVRRKISYMSNAGDKLHAYLLLPAQRTGKLPAVLCLHQTTKIGKDEPAGLGGLPNLHYALELAQRGFITLAPDYPGYGEAVPQADHVKGFASTTAKGIANHRRAVDLLCSLPDVDATRLGCIGHSLGGHNTLFLGLFDERLKVLATSCGFCSFPKYYGGNLKGWSHAGYMPRIASIYQCDPKQMPFDFPEILTALAPRAVFINAPVNDANFAVAGVRDCVDAARPIYQLFGKPEHLVVEYPQAGHDFTKDVRDRCYAFFKKHLQH
jgi:dienelactone hydrolase